MAVTRPTVCGGIDGSDTRKCVWWYRWQWHAQLCVVVPATGIQWPRLLCGRPAAWVFTTDWTVLQTEVAGTFVANSSTDVATGWKYIKISHVFFHIKWYKLLLFEDRVPHSLHTSRRRHIATIALVRQRAMLIPTVVRRKYEILGALKGIDFEPNSIYIFKLVRKRKKTERDHLVGPLSPSKWKKSRKKEAFFTITTKLKLLLRDRKYKHLCTRMSYTT